LSIKNFFKKKKKDNEIKIKETEVKKVPCKNIGLGKNRKKLKKRVLNFTKVNIPCLHCGKSFLKETLGSKFCSLLCRKTRQLQLDRERRKAKPVEFFKCVVCKKKFKRKIYNQITCSKFCRKEKEKRYNDNWKEKNERSRRKEKN
jgi:hypothetical protein